jgi:uncharacterized protein (TIGR02145 family)
LVSCSDGWHLPSIAEWTKLKNYLAGNGYNFDGTIGGNKIAKALASTSGWDSSSKIGAVGNTDYPEKRNATGFSALPTVLGVYWKWDYHKRKDDKYEIIEFLQYCPNCDMPISYPECFNCNYVAQ